MTPVRTEYSNVTFRAEGCIDLPGTAVTNPDGFPEVETCWELTDAELEQITKERRIYLYTMGRSVPPMFLSAVSLLRFGGEPDEI